MHRLPSRLIAGIFALTVLAGCPDPEPICTTNADCDDQNACTSDTCDPQQGSCGHSAVALDDSNACTTDACDPATGVSHTPVSVDDGNACTADACNPTTGVSHTPVNVDDNNVCTTDACSPATGVSHTPVNIDDSNACTTDACDPVSGVSHAPVNTDDSNACTTDACDPASGVSHTPVNIDDSNACTTDACDPVSGVSHTPVNTDDSNACTTDACDPASGVSHTPVNTDDGVACTDDACDPATGVSHTPNNANCSDSDGFSCTVPRCHLTLDCQEVPDDMRCADNQSCTTSDVCMGTGGAPGTGCSYTRNDAMCDDGAACTTEVCLGAGAGDPATGCSYTTDNAQCRRYEVCQVGGCAPGGQSGGLVITELSVLGSEAVELHNASSAPLDIRGFELENFSGQTAAIRHASDPDGTAGTAVTLAPGAYAYGVPNPAAGGTIPAGATFVYGAQGTTFAFADTGDLLSVFSGGGAALHDFVDFRSFVTDPNAVVGAAAFPGFSGKSTQLDQGQLTSGGNDSGASWCVTFRSADTLGAANGSCGLALINEARIDALGTDDGKTFIELVGPGGALIGGAKLEDIEGTGTTGSRNTDADQNPGEVEGEITIPAGTRLPVDGFLIVADRLGAGPGTSVPNVQANDLIFPDVDMENSSKDSIQLLSPAGTYWDSLAHDVNAAPLDAPAGFNGLPIMEGPTAVRASVDISLARDNASGDTGDNSADFHGDPTPTPGAPNGTVSFAITSITPDDALGGVATPGITLTGTDIAIGSQVMFGSVAAAGCSVTPPTRITCTAPIQPPGRVDVSVTNALSVGGTATLTAGFTYTFAQNETDAPDEVDYCVLQWPTSTTVQTGQQTELIFGRIYEAGLTDPPGADATIIAELGYGPIVAGTPLNPTTQPGWTWVPGTFNLQIGNDDEYMATFIAPAAGSYAYTARFSLDGGLSYTYCDLDGAGSNVGLQFDLTQLGVMTVTP